MSSSINRFIIGLGASTLVQIAAMTLCAALAVFAAFYVHRTMLWPDTPPQPLWPWRAAFRICLALDAPLSESTLELSQRLGRDKALSLIARDGDDAPTCSGRSRDLDELQALLRDGDGTAPLDATARLCPEGPREAQILISRGGHKLELRAAPPPAGDRYVIPLFATWVCFTAGFLTLSAWATPQVALPLRRLARRVEKIGRGGDAVGAPLPLEGVGEIRAVAAAINRLQNRAADMVADRTLMLTAVSHDLRTPLTRLRLLLEAGDDRRSKFLREVKLMQSIVQTALGFLAGSRMIEPREWIDLDALVATLCEDFQDAGFAVHYGGNGPVALFGAPEALTRALSNLIENGLRYGAKVEAKIFSDDVTVTIEILDDGPGLAADHLDEASRPFVRFDGARSGGAAGGLGLGLAIARKVADDHGGALALSNRAPRVGGGLSARLILPKL